MYPEVSDVGLTNDRHPRIVWAFKDTANLEELGFRTHPLPDLTGLTTAKFVLRFWTTVTSGNHHWQVVYKAVAAAESADPSTDDDTLQPAADGVPGTARDMDTLDFTAATGDVIDDLAAGDNVFGKLGRRGDGSDTAAATLYVESLHLELS